MISINDVINAVQFWLRLAIFLHDLLKNSLIWVLHNKLNDPSYDGLPEDPYKLYEFFKNHKTLQQLIKNKKLQQDQINLIFPPNDNRTFSSKFDVTLTCFLIRNCCDRLQPPANGWGDKNPPDSDQSIAANVIRAREWRNFVHHEEPNEID